LERRVTHYDVDILVVNYNTANLLPEMFAAIAAAVDDKNVRFLVVDNASTDASVTVLKERYPDIYLEVNSTNLGFGRANNQLLPRISAKYALLLNTDAFVSPDTLTKTVAYLDKHPACGVLGVRLVGRDGTLQPSCRNFPTPFNLFLTKTGLAQLFPAVSLMDDMAWDHATARECDWVPGCYYLIRREVIDQVGLFDPRFFLYYEEVDHCRRVKAAGWQVVYFPDTEVVHIGGESAKSAGELTDSGRQLSALQVESELLYFRKHYGSPGIALHLLLVVLGDVILVLKHFVKGRWGGIPVCWKNHALTWRLFRATKWATCATR